MVCDGGAGWTDSLRADDAAGAEALVEEDDAEAASSVDGGGFAAHERQRRSESLSVGNRASCAAQMLCSGSSHAPQRWAVRRGSGIAQSGALQRAGSFIGDEELCRAQRAVHKEREGERERERERVREQERKTSAHANGGCNAIAQRMQTPQACGAALQSKGCCVAHVWSVPTFPQA